MPAVRQPRRAPICLPQQQRQPPEFVAGLLSQLSVEPSIAPSHSASFGCVLGIGNPVAFSDSISIGTVASMRSGSSRFQPLHDLFGPSLMWETIIMSWDATESTAYLAKCRYNIENLEGANPRCSC